MTNPPVLQRITKLSLIQMRLPIVLINILLQLQRQIWRTQISPWIFTYQTNQSFLIYDCDSDEIKNIISSFHTKKGYGPNSTDTTILQLLKDEISGPLCEIFNLSFSTGLHPDILKVSNTIPIFKNSSRLLVSNNRPI